MVNEMLGTTDGIDSGGKIRQDTNKVTEQDIQHANSDSAKSKKVQTQIKKQKGEDNNIANFLTFLLKNIKNEELISAIYNTFFKVIDTRTKTIYLKKKVNNILIIGFFAPFFLNEIQKFKLMEHFETLYQFDGKELSLSVYISYIKKLSSKYHDNVPINQNNLLDFLVLLLGNFGILNGSSREDGKRKINKELSKK